MKNYEYLQAQNEEITNENAYLGRQLAKSLMKRRKAIWSSPSLESVHGGEAGDEHHSSDSSLKE